MEQMSINESWNDQRKKNYPFHILHWSWIKTCQILTHGTLGLPFIKTSKPAIAFVVNITITLI
jgi:hypothetical protein